MITTDVTVIGGGAAGLLAAITAAGCGARTTLIEHMDRVGKKLLSTGNGRCNYTNAMQDISCYRGECPAFVLPVFAQFGHEETVAWFRELGIWPKTRGAYFYPASDQAASVLDVLRMECAYRRVDLHTGCHLSALKKDKKYWQVSTSQGAISTKTVIFATGLLAAPKTGSDGSAIPYIEGLGHHFIDIVPALVQLQGKQSFFRSLAGIRAEALISLQIQNGHFSPGEASAGEETVYREQGELQLTDFGISGIPVFQLSRFATRALSQKRRVTALIDFLPSVTREETLALLAARFGGQAHGKTAQEALVGLFHKKLGEVLLKEAGIPLHLPAAQVSAADRERLTEQIKRLRVDIIGSKGMDAAQVCAGGVDTREVDPATLESKLAGGIYFAGEVLDIDGACGGYNLQWAWSSGYVAGSHAAAAALGAPFAAGKGTT